MPELKDTLKSMIKKQVVLQQPDKSIIERQAKLQEAMRRESIKIKAEKG